MWLVAIVLDIAFLDTTKVNVQQLKMQLRRKWIFSSLRPNKKARKPRYLFKKQFCPGKSLRPVTIYCHPIRQEKTRQFNVNSSFKLSGGLSFTPRITLYVFLWSSFYLTLNQNQLLFLHLSLGRFNGLAIWVFPSSQLRGWLFLDVLTVKPKNFSSTMIREYFSCNGSIAKEKKITTSRGRWI